MKIISFGSITFIIVCLLVILDKGFNLKGYGTDYLEIGSLFLIEFKCV